MISLFRNTSNKHVFRTIAQWALALHIYVSMTGFLLLFLFAITGLALNHGDFGLSEPELVTSTRTLAPSLVDRPSKEMLSEYSRTILGVSSPLTLYREYAEEIELQFAAPGGRTHVLINRADRTARVEVETRGLWGKIGDLHKGRHSGRVWFWMIDVTAVLFVISSLTGMITLASLPARRRNGFFFGVLGVVFAIAIYVIWVPQ